VRDQFAEMLDYFGQSPIVVRSSSLLEDSFGSAFSGQYESIFCANQGSPQERLEAFLAAVRHIYASAMGRDALLYRAQRGLLDRDEQMALFVQRVSGAAYGRLFFPQVAGVGLSFNPFAWHPVNRINEPDCPDIGNRGVFEEGAHVGHESGFREGPGQRIGVLRDFLTFKKLPVPQAQFSNRHLAAQKFRFKPRLLRLTAFVRWGVRPVPGSPSGGVATICRRIRGREAMRRLAPDRYLPLI
jgi:hypothetical protein